MIFKRLAVLCWKRNAENWIEKLYKNSVKRIFREEITFSESIQKENDKTDCV